jgi:Uma2 family endonuclease
MAKMLTATEIHREHRIVLRNIDWALYENLLAAHLDRSVPRFTYDHGDLEIMSPSAEHEEIKDIVTLLVNIWAPEQGLDIRSFGSTTFRREDLDRGFEPDACFYIKSVELIKGKFNVDLNVDPPPDLLVEIDITNSSIDKVGMYAEIGGPEVWRYDGNRVVILTLEGSGYLAREESVCLPGLTSAVLLQLIESGRSGHRPEWLRQVRERAHGGRPQD